MTDALPPSAGCYMKEDGLPVSFRADNATVTPACTRLRLSPVSTCHAVRALLPLRWKFPAQRDLCCLFLICPGAAAVCPSASTAGPIRLQLGLPAPDPPPPPQAVACSECTPADALFHQQEAQTLPFIRL